ncbi:MAG TPA: PQQ-binding-like beta-propeller repeat protein [Thermomicrobiales bacterium]|nr:PQQ-binding-like beta-propeller repeat protein [Thermomicrobiales bacterium]
MESHSDDQSKPTVSRLHLNRRRFLAAAATATAIATAGARVPALAQDSATPAAAALPVVPPELTQYAKDWPTPQGNAANQRNATGSTITSKNVGDLEIAWSFPIKATSGSGGLTCTPLIAGQVVYIQDMQSNVFALDRDTGKQIWEAPLNAGTEGPNGVALGYGMIFASTGDNRELVALDAATGKEKWRTLLSGNTRDGIDMAPAVYNGMVFISTVPGNGKAFYDGGARGILFALDAASGQILWQFYTTDADLWGDPSVNSGGGSWYPPAIDPDGNLYWDIANPAPFEPTSIAGTPVPNGSTREGSNLYSDSMVKLAPNGKLEWFYQANPHDIFDHDLQQSPVFVHVDNNGQPYDVLLGSGKLGKVIAVESTTGNMIWTTKVGEHNQWDDSQWVPPGQTVTVLPGVSGGVESPIAVADGVVYVPVLNLGTGFDSNGFDASTFSYNDATGELVALDIFDGSIKWDVKLPAGNVSGATVSNDVVFAGALDGIVRAYATADGTLLASYQLDAGLNSPFAVAGDLLIVPAAGAKLVSQTYVAESTPTASTGTGAAVVAFKVKS